MKYSFFKDLNSDLRMIILKKRTELIIKYNYLHIEKICKTNIIMSIKYYMKNNNVHIKLYKNMIKYELFKIIKKYNIKIQKKNDIDLIVVRNLFKEFNISNNIKQIY